MFLIIIAIAAATVLFLRKLRWDFAQPDVKDKVVFISGGSSGIGEEMAK